MRIVYRFRSYLAGIISPDKSDMPVVSARALMEAMQKSRDRAASPEMDKAVKAHLKKLHSASFTN